MANTYPNFFLTTLAQSLASGGSESEIYVSSITLLDGTVIQTSDFATFGRGILTIDPQSTSRTEFVAFTTVDAGGVGFTGISRGLSFNSNSSVAANKKFHPVGAQVLISFGSHNIQDIVDKFTGYAAIASPETITGLWTFTTSPVAPTPTLNTQVAIKSYVDGVAVAGAPNANTTTKGIVQEATQAQVDIPGSVGSTGADLFIRPDRLRNTRIYDLITDSGTANTYALNPTIPATFYQSGQIFSFTAAHANTGASTLEVSSLGPKSIKKSAASLDLLKGDILTGQLVVVEFDGTNFQMISPLPINIASGNFQYPGDAASQSYVVNHTLGVVPRFIELTAAKGISSLIVASSSGSYNNAGNSQSVSTFISTTGAYACTVDASTTFVLIIRDTDVGGGVYQTAVVSAVSAATFTLGWVKTNSPNSNNINVMWKAYA